MAAICNIKYNPTIDHLYKLRWFLYFHFLRKFIRETCNYIKRPHMTIGAEDIWYVTVISHWALHLPATIIAQFSTTSIPLLCQQFKTQLRINNPRSLGIKWTWKWNIKTARSALIPLSGKWMTLSKWVCIENFAFSNNFSQEFFKFSKIPAAFIVRLWIISWESWKLLPNQGVAGKDEVVAGTVDGALPQDEGGRLGKAIYTIQLCHRASEFKMAQLYLENLPQRRLIKLLCWQCAKNIKVGKFSRIWSVGVTDNPSSKSEKCWTVQRYG